MSYSKRRTENASGALLLPELLCRLGENVPYDGPFLHFGLKRHRRVSRTSRRQADKDMPIFRQRRQDMTAKCRLRPAAVKAHMRNGRILREESRKIVGHLFRDRRVETAGPYACLKRIPQSDAR